MEKHHTKEKGDLGLLAVSLDLAKKGYKIFTSSSEHLPFDLIAYKDRKFFRIQVKYRKATDGVSIMIPFKTVYADRNGSHIHRYDLDSLDFFAVYCPDTEKCYYVDPQSCCINGISLRLNKPVNNQEVHLAEDYLDIPKRFTLLETV